jgi:hypothetical protein
MILDDRRISAKNDKRGRGDIPRLDYIIQEDIDMRNL